MQLSTSVLEDDCFGLTFLLWDPVSVYRFVRECTVFFSYSAFQVLIVKNLSGVTLITEKISLPSAVCFCQVLTLSWVGAFVRLLELYLHGELDMVTVLKVIDLLIISLYLYVHSFHLGISLFIFPVTKCYPSTVQNISKAHRKLNTIVTI